MPTMMPLMIYCYMLAVHVLLPGIAIFMYGTPSDPLGGLGAESLFPAGSSDVVTVALYAVGALFVILAFTWPKHLASKAQNGLVPYVIRLTLLEACTISGFVLSLLKEAPFAVLPFAAVGLFGALLSRPSDELLARLAKPAGD